MSTYVNTDGKQVYVVEKNEGSGNEVTIYGDILSVWMKIDQNRLIVDSNVSQIVGLHYDIRASNLSKNEVVAIAPILLWLYDFGGGWSIYQVKDVPMLVEDSEDIWSLNLPRDCWRVHGQYEQIKITKQVTSVKAYFYYEKQTGLLLKEIFYWSAEYGTGIDRFELVRTEVPLPFTLPFISSLVKIWPIAILIVGSGVVFLCVRLELKMEKERRKRAYEKAFG
jgi:hypothetical protein